MKFEHVSISHIHEVFFMSSPKLKSLYPTDDLLHIDYNGWFAIQFFFLIGENASELKSQSDSSFLPITRLESG